MASIWAWVGISRHSQPKSFTGRNVVWMSMAYFSMQWHEMWGHFHMLHVVLSSLIHKSTLNLILLRMVCKHVRCFFWVLALLVVSNASAAHVQVCTSLPAHWWVHCNCRVSSAQPVLSLIAPSWIPQHRIPCLNFPVPLLSWLITNYSFIIT